MPETLPEPRAPRLCSSRVESLCKLLRRLPAIGGPPAGVCPFVILTHPRSGSTWLVELLGSHPATTVFAELFLGDGSGYPRFGDQQIPFYRSYSERTERSSSNLRNVVQHVRYLDMVFGSSVSAGCAVGFKLMYQQAREHPALLGYLAYHDVRVVHLVRRNALDRIMSDETRKASGLAHATDREVVRELSIRLEPADLLRRIRLDEALHEEARAFLRHVRLPAVEVGYEELRREPEALGRVIDFLHLEGNPSDLGARVVKLAASSQRDRLENYDEVARTLRGTPYAWMLT